MGAKTTKNEINSLEDALQMLDNAAQKSGQEVQDMIRADYRNLRRALEEITPEVKTALSAVTEKASEAVKATAENTTAFAKETAHNVDQHAKAHPWWYVGGAAVAGGVIGYFLAREE